MRLNTSDWGGKVLVRKREKWTKVMLQTRLRIRILFFFDGFR